MSGGLAVLRGSSGLTQVISGQSRDRTGDLRIFSPSLYQLSYLSIAKGHQFPSANGLPGIMLGKAAALATEFDPVSDWRFA